MWRSSALLVVGLALVGCDDASVGNRTQRSGAVKVAIDDPLDENLSKSPEGVGTPMAWRVVSGAAFYGAADQIPAFALRCDRRSESIVFERAGGGSALTLSAGGIGTSLTTRAAGNGRIQATIGMDDIVLDAMARSQAQISVGGGGDALTVPGGIAVRRVVDFCREPPAPPPAIDNSTAPVPVVPPLVPPPLPSDGA